MQRAPTIVRRHQGFTDLEQIACGVRDQEPFVVLPVGLVDKGAVTDAVVDVGDVCGERSF